MKGRNCIQLKLKCSEVPTCDFGEMLLRRDCFEVPTQGQSQWHVLSEGMGFLALRNSTQSIQDFLMMKAKGLKYSCY